MISNDKLQHKLQIASYTIITESLTEEERTMMNLQPSEIIPTISFFYKVQKELFQRFCETKTYLERNVEFEYCYEKWNYQTRNFYIEPAVSQVNFAFLKRLCQDNCIEFYKFEDRYHFETSNREIYNNTKKKFLIHP